MKLIIDIPDNIYYAIKITQPFISGKISGKTYLQILVNSVQNSTPLDDVKAEIDNEWANTHHMYPDYASGLAWASEIIDKHIGKAESEDKE